MFRTFASAEFKHSMVDDSYIKQFKHLLKLYKDWCNPNADNKKEIKNKAIEYFKNNQWFKWSSTKENNTHAWEKIYKSNNFNDMDIVNVYNWLKGKKVEMLGTLPKKLQMRAALQYASEELKKDKDVVMVAVAQNGLALEYASDELKNDKEVVMAAVTQKGLALQYASAELKNDKEVVLAAVAQNVLALKYASDDLKNNDKDVVMAAVAQDGYALQYASDELKKDKEVVLAAELKNDKD